MRSKVNLFAVCLNGNIETNKRMAGQRRFRHGAAAGIR
jgi:hypothetical protein